HLSSEHGQVFREGERFIFKDLRSTNGSRLLRKGGELLYIDGSRGFEAELEDGDQLLLGDPLDPVAVAFRPQVAEKSAPEPEGGLRPTVRLENARAPNPTPSPDAEPDTSRVLARR